MNSIQVTLFAMTTLSMVPIFSDHMVLQRGQPNKIWGWDAPGTPVQITIEGPKSHLTIDARTTADGAWQAEMPELPVGGPYEIAVQGSSLEVLSDVLVGDVWLAGGQSNMEWHVSDTMNAALEIETSANPQVRQFLVLNDTAQEPQENLDGGWTVAGPQTTGGFSAIGYFFAREVQQRTGVPVGIINSNWGGTRVEAWGSKEAMQPVLPASEYSSTPEQLKADEAAIAQFDKDLKAWETKYLPTDLGNTKLAAGWADVRFDDSTWKEMDLPAFWQLRGLEINGVLWFRREVEVPAGWAGKDLVLSLGAVDDYDTTYFNGVEVGSVPPPTPNAHIVQRRYVVPARLVKAGKAVVTVRVYDRIGQGGFGGPAPRMFIAPEDEFANRIPLSGKWKYQIEHNFGLVPSTVWNVRPQEPSAYHSQNRASTLYNAMIHPITRYGIKGAIWYQGESNTAPLAVAQDYANRFAAMIQDWRTRFGQGDFPFLFVQLANFHDVSHWPELREQQAKVLDMLPNTGMVVAIDIGNPWDIHPRNKQAVGHRLALVAMDKVYDIPGAISSGPVFLSVDFADGAAKVYFDNAAQLHTSDGAREVRGFQLAGKDGVYHPAQARIVPGYVEVKSPDVPEPAYIRYAWDVCPVVNLVNEVYLPAAPFRTDNFSPKE